MTSPPARSPEVGQAEGMEPVERTVTTRLTSPIGPLRLAARNGRLTGLHLEASSNPPLGTDSWIEDRAAFADAERQLEEYFAGERTAFDLDLDLAGTPFQRAVWQGLLTIGYADTWSYTRLALEIGNPRACRAVGLANGRNPIAVIVPCHRVIAADGTLGGYGGGPERKSYLLELERRVLARRCG